MYIHIYICVLIRCGNPARDLIFGRFRATSDECVSINMASRWNLGCVVHLAAMMGPPSRSPGLVMHFTSQKNWDFTSQSLYTL